MQITTSKIIFGDFFLKTQPQQTVAVSLFMCVLSPASGSLAGCKSHSAKSLGQQLDEQALLAGQLDFSVGSSFFGFAMMLDWPGADVTSERACDSV